MPLYLADQLSLVERCSVHMSHAFRDDDNPSGSTPLPVAAPSPSSRAPEPASPVSPMQQLEEPSLWIFFDAFRYGGFRKLGYPHSWMVSVKIPIWKWMIGGYPHGLETPRWVEQGPKSEQHLVGTSAFHLLPAYD